MDEELFDKKAVRQNINRRSAWRRSFRATGNQAREFIFALAPAGLCLPSVLPHNPNTHPSLSREGHMEETGVGAGAEQQGRKEPTNTENDLATLVSLSHPAFPFPPLHTTSARLEVHDKSVQTPKGGMFVTGTRYRPKRILKSFFVGGRLLYEHGVEGAGWGLRGVGLRWEGVVWSEG